MFFELSAYLCIQRKVSKEAVQEIHLIVVYGLLVIKYNPTWKKVAAS